MFGSLVRIFCVFVLFSLWTSDAAAQQKELFKHVKEIEKKQNNYNKLHRGWNLNLNSSLTVTQTTYHQWASGGSNVFVWTAGLDGSAIYDTLFWNWANEAKILFGYSKQNGELSRKTNDVIDLESVLTLKKTTYLNPYFSLNLLTQLAPGYKYQAKTKNAISDFFDPAYVTNGLGIGYSPKKTFRTRFGLATRTIITNRYNDFASGREIRFDSGLQWVTHAERRFWNSLLFRSRLNMFSSFQDVEQGTITWDTLMQASITKYIIVNLQTYLIYDPKVSLSTQIKEVLSIGLRYTFI